MSSQKTSPRMEENYLRVNHVVFVSAVILDVAIVFTVWDDPFRRWLVIGICALLALLNATVFPWLYKILNLENDEFGFRDYMNNLGQAAKVVVAGATLPTWGWLFIMAAVVDSERYLRVMVSILVLLGVQVATSIYVGADWIHIATLSALTLLIMALSSARSKVLLEALDEQERQRQEIERGANELRQMQKLATQQEKMSSLGMLAAGIAHEINNPMAFVTSNISQLETDLPHLCHSKELLTEYQREVIPEIREGIVRVNTIVADLRRFARGDVEFRSTFDVNEVIRSTVRMTHGHLGPGVSLSLSLIDIPLQSGFPRQLSQVVVNLLVNAAQAVADGGTIRVKTDCERDSWRLTIEDNGPGMDADTQTKIFDPFFTTKPPGEGTGLGLSAVHGIVKQLKGRIDVKSAKGAGARFTVTLPLNTVAQADHNHDESVTSATESESLPPAVAYHRRKTPSTPLDKSPVGEPDDDPSE